MRSAAGMAQRPSPYTFLVAESQPNYSRAVQTMAHNQTLANEAEIACALEVYRLAHGQCPEALNALTPELIQKLPHDLIGGAPLKYRRAEAGGYVLYSIGWDEKD